MSELPKDKRTLSFGVNRDLVGLPGQPFRFRLTRVSSNETTQAAGEEAKEFDIVFTLSRPGEALCGDDTAPNSEMLGGNSYFRLRASNADDVGDFRKVTFHVVTDNRLFEIQELINEQGFIGKVEILSVKAKDFGEAEDIARRLISPSLSWYSTHFDVPLNIYQVDVVDLATGDFMIYRAAKPYDALVIPQGIRVLDIKEEAGAYASIYREALNSNSHIYQFLCFYKILDGISQRRERLAAEARASGRELIRVPERLPRDVDGLLMLLKKTFAVDFTWTTAEAESIFPKQFWGRKFSHILEKELRPLRNEVAHAFLESSIIPLSLDAFQKRSKVVQYLPMTKCFARMMLNNEFPLQFPSRP